LEESWFSREHSGPDSDYRFPNYDPHLGRKNAANAAGYHRAKYVAQGRQRRGGVEDVKGMRDARHSSAGKFEVRKRFDP
jgi:hypothetical protein